MLSKFKLGNIADDIELNLASRLFRMLYLLIGSSLVAVSLVLFALLINDIFSLLSNVDGFNSFLQLIETIYSQVLQKFLLTLLAVVALFCFALVVRLNKSNKFSSICSSAYIYLFTKAFPIIGTPFIIIIAFGPPSSEKIVHYIALTISLIILLGLFSMSHNSEMKK